MTFWESRCRLLVISIEVLLIQLLLVMLYTEATADVLLSRSKDFFIVVDRLATAQLICLRKLVHSTAQSIDGLGVLVYLLTGFLKLLLILLAFVRG
jgi:hypothetical protein